MANTETDQNNIPDAKKSHHDGDGSNENGDGRDRMDENSGETYLEDGVDDNSKKDNYYDDTAVEASDEVIDLTGDTYCSSSNYTAARYDAITRTD